jgi:type II secretory pathway predicted ATPase ExeA
MSQSDIRITAKDKSDASNAASWNTETLPGHVERRAVERLFLEYYGLNEQPFGVTPDLRFLYLGAKHREALDKLNYATELNRGFLTLIAKPGMGKTSLLFDYLEGMRNKARTVFLFQTDGDSTQLMRYLLAELGLDGKGMDLPEMRAVLSKILLGEMQAGRRFVLVIDEAQNLDERVLESIRLLSNFETPWMKLLHIVLSGQPELAERLAKPSMAQLRQRISFAIRLEPFTREEVDLYINHRLWVAGFKALPLFSIGARTLIAERSEGIPRNINNLCFRAMSYAWAMKRKTVERDAMAEVLADIDPEQRIENDVVAEKAPAESKIGARGPSQPIGLTLKPPAARSGLSTVMVVLLVLLSLCWLGFQPNVEKWAGNSYSTMSAAVRSFLHPTTAPQPASAIGTASSSAKPKQASAPAENDVTVPQEDEVEVSSTSGGTQVR